MVLKDDVQKTLNEMYAEIEHPIEITELLLYKPELYDPWGRFTIFNTIEELMDCDSFSCNLVFEEEEKEYEYTLLYVQNGLNSFELSSDDLKYCEFEEGDTDFDVLKNRMRRTINLMAMIFIPEVLENLKK